MTLKVAESKLEDAIECALLSFSRNGIKSDGESKRIADDQSFAEFFIGRLFEEYLRSRPNPG